FTYRVSGRLIGGPPILTARIGGDLYLLLNRRSSGFEPDREVVPVELRARVYSDGSFEVSNVPPGTYGVSVFPAAAELLSIPTIVVTDRDLIGLEMALVRTDVVTSRRNLESAWSLPGHWSGVAASEKDGTIYAAVPGADAVSIPLF